MRFAVITLLLLVLESTAAAQFANLTIQLTLRGQVIEGSPLQTPDKQVHLLGRDGKLWSFIPQEAKDFRKTGDGFAPYSHSDFRSALLKEFGSGFDVSGTGHYLVVHPLGQRDKWAPRFEELYRSFVHYFTARGFQPTPPKFPLVAVVCGSQADFMRLATKDGVPPSMTGLLGYYSPVSNRILLYDASSGREATQDWQTNAETIIHEAAHQTAFNTGLHGRYSMPPRWAVEGLGTLFEARGVWNSRDYTKTSDRLNSGRLASFRQLAKSRPTGLTSELLASDRLFQTDIDRAYAESWALTFFLSETEPKKYVDYLARTASQKPFTATNGTERLKDFTDIFGPNLAMLEARFLRFIGEIR